MRFGTGLFFVLRCQPRMSDTRRKVIDRRRHIGDDVGADRTRIAAALSVPAAFVTDGTLRERFVFCFTHSKRAGSGLITPRVTFLIHRHHQSINERATTDGRPVEVCVPLHARTAHARRAEPKPLFRRPGLLTRDTHELLVNNDFVGRKRHTPTGKHNPKQHRTSVAVRRWATRVVVHGRYFCTVVSNGGSKDTNGAGRKPAPR